MNAIHLHLMLGHIPIVLMPVSFVFLLIAYLKGNATLLSSGLALIVVSAVFVAPVYYYGGESEDRVEDIKGVKESKIEQHEEAAERAIWIVPIAGVMAILTHFMIRRRPGMRKLCTIIMLIFSLVGSAALAFTANQGGEIRHPEAYGALEDKDEPEAP